MHDIPPRETLLFYCQHSLGIGHLTRSFALVRALQPHFDIVFLNGGALPDGVPVPEGIERVDLPPLGMDDGHTLVSRAQDGSLVDVATLQARRRQLISDTTARCRPSLLLVELFPFGRKKFAGEILPLIRQVKRQRSDAQVVCSLRDILVDARPDQQRHDDRARWLADRYFDAVLVHADPSLARLDDSFRPGRPLRTLVFHTGYVVPDRTPAAPARRWGDAAAGGGARLAAVDGGTHPVQQQMPHQVPVMGAPEVKPILVSAGGGIVGERLFRAVLAGHARLIAQRGAAAVPPLRIVAGPFLPPAAWLRLQAQALTQPGVTLVRHVPDLVAELRRACASISQCGYNSALDLLVAGTPALVVPYDTRTENEQRQRAIKLVDRQAWQWMPAEHADDDATMAQAIDALLGFTPRPAGLKLDGARRSAQVLVALREFAQSAHLADGGPLGQSTPPVPATPSGIASGIASGLASGLVSGSLAGPVVRGRGTADTLRRVPTTRTG